MPAIYKNGKNYGGGAIVDSILSSTSTNPVQNKVVKQALDELILNFANYYNKTEVDNIVNAIKNSRFEAVSTLPTTDIKTNIIYLVPKSPTQTNNAKDEYINLDGTSSGWEKIGDTEIDLSGYVTTNALNTALSNYTTTTDLTTLLNNKVDKAQGKGLSTNDYTNEEKQKNADNTSAIEDLQEDISQPLTATGNPITIESSESNLVECVAEVEAVQEGSGDPSPTNIRPITGQTEVVIDDVGKNLVEDKINGYYIDAQGSFFQDARYTIVYGKVEAGKTYTITTDDSDGFVGGFFTDKPTIASVTYNSSRIDSTDKTFVAPIDGYVGFRTSANYATPQCELGNQATTYEPYKGKTYTIQLGDTIYGGESDVLTGKMRVTHGEVDLGDLNWQYLSSYASFVSNISDIYNVDTSDYSRGLVCSSYQAVNYWWTDLLKPDHSISHGSPKNVIIKDSSYSDASAFKTAVTGQTLVYELAEPYTIQLTPQQIRLLKGTNHLSCNTGDLTIKYYPDNVLGQLKGDIEKGLNAYYDYQIQVLWDKIEELQA